MQVMSFDSLEAANAFLAERGLPLISSGTEESQPNEFGPMEALMKMAFGDEELCAATIATVPKDQFDALVELYSVQVARLVQERDDAIKMLERERESHQSCHNGFDAFLTDQIQNARLTGYVDCLLVGPQGIVEKFKLFENQQPVHQQAFINMAEKAISRIDILRANED